MINTVLMRLAAMSYRNALILAAIAGFIYFNSPLFDDGSDLQKQIDDTRKRADEQQALLVQSEQALREVEKVRKSVGALQEQFKSVTQQLPTEIVVSEIVRSVDMLGRTSGVSVKDKEPRPPSRQDFLEVHPLRIRAEGTYSELTNFMYFLASTERITRVRNFVFSIDGNRTGGGRLTFEGEVLSYRFVAEAPKEKQ